MHRSVILGLARRTCGVYPTAPASDPEIAEAIGALDRIKAEGLAAVPGELD